MKHSFKICQATIEDSPKIIGIWEETALTRPWNDPATDVSLALSGKTSTIFLAKDDNETIGTCMAGYDGHRGWIYYLAVLPSYQGKGIGRILFDAAESWLAENQAPKIQILIRSDNQKVISFYEAIGFEKSTSILMGKAIEKTGFSS